MQSFFPVHEIYTICVSPGEVLNEYLWYYDKMQLVTIVLKHWVEKSPIKYTQVCLGIWVALCVIHDTYYSCLE